MALQVWLPLTGNLKNQGLSDVEIPNVTLLYDTTGKIGKAFTLKTSPQLYFIEPSLVDAQIFSFAFWYKPISDSSITANWRNLFQLGDINTEGTAGTLRVQSSYGSVSSQYVISIHNNTSYGIASVGYVFTNEWDKWHHIAFTCDGNECKGYLNGTLVKTDTFNGGKLSGKIWVGAGSGGANGLMNDLRIYDHALSPKEVKELSKGLVAHYPLNDMIGGENLIKDSYIERTCEYPSSGVKDFYAPITTKVPSGTTYTLSFYAKSTVNGDHLRTHYYSPNTTTTCVSSQGITKTASDGHMDFVLTTEWKYYWVVYNQSETTAVKHVICPRLISQAYASSVSGTGIISVKMVKFEKGSKATPWIPNSADALYSKMGLDNGIVYDCSGYEHNGTVVGSGVSYSSETPRYTCSTDFQQSDATNSYINLGTGGKVSDEITVSEWVYMDTWTTDPHPFSCTEGGGWNIEKNSNKPTFPVNVNTVGYVHSINGDISTPLWTDLSSGWHMFTGTYDGFNVKLYIDGELVANKATGKTDKLPIHYHATNPIVIHSEATSTTGSNSYPACKMSDMRIYATALSAEDIKSLYETRASIDNYNNVYAYELMEV